MAVENVFNFYSSDSYQQVGNCLYPYHFIVKSAEDFKEMASHDHVCVMYKNNYRGTENFVESNVHQYDVDNHHSEKDCHRLVNRVHSGIVVTDSSGQYR